MHRKCIIAMWVTVAGKRPTVVFIYDTALVNQLKKWANGGSLLVHDEPQKQQSQQQLNGVSVILEVPRNLNSLLVLILGRY